MSKVSQRNLKKKLSDGWDVDKVDPPKPKKTPKPLLRDVIAEGIEKSSAESQKAIAAMAESISAFIKAQSKAEPGEQVIKVEIPEPKEEKRKKRTLELTIHRDRDLLMEKVIIKEI